MGKNDIQESQVNHLQKKDYPRKPLSRREKEVLQYIATGKTNQAIADILGLSVRTIDKHVENILLKMKVENRAMAVGLMNWEMNRKNILQRPFIVTRRP